MKFRLLVFSCLLLMCSRSIDDITSIHVPIDDDEAENFANCINATYPVWSNSPYVLPYPTSKSYLVIRSNCNAPEHAEGSSDQFAIDFAMSLGSIVAASREGLVVSVLQNQTDNSSQANGIVIKHADNTYAIYRHLTFEGSLVSVGDSVEKGEPIGLSGSSGAPQAMLHFVVTSGSYSYPYTSVACTFFNTVSNPVSLLEGVYYLAEAY